MPIPEEKIKNLIQGAKIVGVKLDGRNADGREIIGIRVITAENENLVISANGSIVSGEAG